MLLITWFHKYVPTLFRDFEKKIIQTIFEIIFDFRPLIQNLDKCEQEIYVNASTTYITSPNYPQNYDNNVNCNWILKSDPLARIVVTIVYVSMESSVRRCRYDVLTIFDGKYGSREDWNR